MHAMADVRTGSGPSSSLRRIPASGSGTRTVPSRGGAWIDHAAAAMAAMAAVALLAVTVGCEPARTPAMPASGAATSDGASLAPSHVRGVSEDDDALRAASHAARMSFPTFVARLADSSASGTVRTVQVRLTDGVNVEHIWLDSVRYDGRALSGTLNDDPVVLRSMRRGTRVTTVPDQLVDWIAIDDGRLCGGYTVRLEYRHASRSDRDALARAFQGARIPDDSSTCGPPE